MYVVLYKYDYYISQLPSMHVGPQNFPFRALMFYAIVTSLYMIPYYRWLAPMLFKRRHYWLFGLLVIVYFGYVSKVNFRVCSHLFDAFNQQPLLTRFFANEKIAYSVRLTQFFTGWDLRILVTDFVTFTSLFFMRYAAENEEKRHNLETDNLMLQLESLKAQLHPHFLFNTLNSLYGMSLTRSPDTPAFILRLSDMLRFVLYDCQHNKVLLEKDVEFLRNYIEMEKKRYPNAAIEFKTDVTEGRYTIAPLLFITFVENSFKHGAHRISDKGYVRGTLQLRGNRLEFIMENDIFTVPQKETPYGGIGIENAKKRLALYYPGQHHLQIDNDGEVYRVTVSVQLNQDL